MIFYWSPCRSYRTDEKSNNYDLTRLDEQFRNAFRGPVVSSRAYAFGREIVCSQKSLGNRKFLKMRGMSPFLFVKLVQQRRTQNHAKPAHRVRRSSGQPFSGTTRSAGVGGGLG